MPGLIERLTKNREREKAVEKAIKEEIMASAESEKRRNEELSKRLALATATIMPRGVLDEINQQVLKGEGELQSSDNNLSHSLNWDRRRWKKPGYYSSKGGKKICIEIGERKNPLTDKPDEGVAIYGGNFIKTKQITQFRQKSITITNGDFISLSDIHNANFRDRFEQAIERAYLNPDWARHIDYPSQD